MELLQKFHFAGIRVSVATDHGYGRVRNRLTLVLVASASFRITLARFGGLLKVVTANAMSRACSTPEKSGRSYSCDRSL